MYLILTKDVIGIPSTTRPSDLQLPVQSVVLQDEYTMQKISRMTKFIAPLSDRGIVRLRYMFDVHLVNLAIYICDGLFTLCIL